jgi:L-threonylcarbamoyladenylate synthase
MRENYRMSYFSQIDYVATIERAVATLSAGGLVAFPTETVYGLGADAGNEHAVARIYEVKNRPANHPLIVHIASVEMLSDWAEQVPDYATVLAQNFWPGPMTLIVKRSGLAGDFVTGGQDTVGVRIPDHPLALGLLVAFAKTGGIGVAAPSANRFGQVSPTTAQAVVDEIEDYLAAGDLILDGGSCDVGVESTIIDCTGDAPIILRPGAITSQMISGSTGIESVVVAKASAIRFSGSLDAHYSPKAKVVLDQAPIAGQGFIAMAGIMAGEGVVRLASPISHDDFARVLYSALRAADQLKLKTVVIAQPEGSGIAIAIRDRLFRASRGR